MRAVVALAELRQRNTQGFLDVVTANEFTVYALLSGYGFHGSWVRPQDYLPDFDHAFARWLQAGNLRLDQLPPQPLQMEPEDTSPILAALPDGTGFVGTRRQYNAAAHRQRVERSLRTLSNIAGGIGGAVGYGLGGDEGSDVGSGRRRRAHQPGGAAQQRQQMRDVGSSLGPTVRPRPTCGLLAPDSRPLPHPSLHARQPPP